MSMSPGRSMSFGRPTQGHGRCGTGHASSEYVRMMTGLWMPIRRCASLRYSDGMLASFLLLVSLSQDGATPRPFLWNIEGMDDPKTLTVVTISLTPYGLGNGIEVETISLDPLPTRDDPKPRAIRPLKTEPAPALMSGWRERGLRAWFAPPGRRFHLIVTLSDGSTHRIDIYRPVPQSEPKLKATPIIDRTIPMWTTHKPAASEPIRNP